MNEKIDRLVAEGVMGLELVDGYWCTPDGKIYSELPISPSSDYNHLFMALDKAREDGWGWVYNAIDSKLDFFLRKDWVSTNRLYRGDFTSCVLDALIDAYGLDVEE